MEQRGGGSGEVVEEASPISSRPPANFEELMRFSAADDGGGGGSGGGGGGSMSSGNRWPREETLALLRIRSDMDSVFRDSSLKAPLWENVSRKLSELGFKRSAKKCKEKFENVQKYYKRTKETRGGRSDGKAYKFFTQLEAIAVASSTLDVAPLSVANPIQSPFAVVPAGMSYSSPFTVFPSQPPPPQPLKASIPIFTTPPPAAAVAATSVGVTFSSHSSSTASGTGSDEDDYLDVDAPNMVGPSSSNRKRKRSHHLGGGSKTKAKEFFEGLVRQVLQKQTAMQRTFLEALEKREQERLDREEAWKCLEMSRLAREHELMAQERAACASRDAAIVSLIQNITGHTLQLPPSFTQQPPPPQPWPPQPATTKAASPLQQIQLALHQHSQVAVKSKGQSHLQPIIAIPDQQQIPPPAQQQHHRSGISEPASSRWPKAEVLALIKLRSGLEPRYQDVGSKGPLWTEISMEMQKMGYNRSAKRCKEKWENINKYYKKVKESSKKRPEDAKTCPYFHRLDALYSQKVAKERTQDLNVQSHVSASSSENRNEEHMEESPKGGGLMEGTLEKTEVLVKELTQEEHANTQQQQKPVNGDHEKIEEPHSYNNNMEEEDDEEEELEDDEKTAYEIEFPSNAKRGSNDHAESSFLTMVQ